MQADFHAKVARETARQVHDLQSVTAAQAMPALCFLHGAYAPRRPMDRQRDDAEVAGRTGVRRSVLRPQLKIVKARMAATATESR